MKTGKLQRGATLFRIWCWTVASRDHDRAQRFQSNMVDDGDF